MKRTILITERTVTFPVFTPALLAGVVYNGVALADTVATAAEPDAAAVGKGIDCSNYYRALIVVAAGTVSGDNTITAYVGPKGYEADAAAPNEAVIVPGFVLNVGAAQSGKLIVGELFLQAVKANPAGKFGAQSLWIKKTGDDTAMAVAVVLDDASLEIADGRNTLQAEAVFTG